MGKRLLDCSPKEMLSLNAEKLKAAIKMSEGRTVTALARTCGNNFVQYVTNAEVCAGFGADIVYMDTYNPEDPRFVGLASRDPKEDEPFRDVQLQIGRGWTAKEVRELIGRPLATCLILEKASYGALSVDTGFSEIKGSAKKCATRHTWKSFDLAVEQGFDIIYLLGWCEPEFLIRDVKEAKRRVGNKILIEAGVPHGPGLIYAQNSPFNLRELMTPEYALALCEAGTDIVDIPAAGSLPGFTPEYVGKLIDVIHKAGALVCVGIHNSQEGTDVETIRRLALENKTLGADMYMLGDAGFNENIGIPEVLNALSIAVKGRRHTYRRMSESVLR